MVSDFIIIFIILAVTFTAAVVLVKLMRPGHKEDLSLKSWNAPSDDKRQHPRIDINWPVTVETSEGTKKGMVKNISVGGAFILCDHPLLLDETARFTIETPMNQSLELNAKVIWTNANVQDDKVVHKGMRIQFVHNTHEDMKLLHQAIVSTSQQSIQDKDAESKTRGYENRRDARIDVSWPVEMETSLGHIQAETRHVSVSGAFIACPEPLPLGEKFQLTIAISNQKKVSINAEVMWSNINVPEDKVVNRGMGIRFVDNTKEEIKPLSIALMKIVTESTPSKD